MIHQREIKQNIYTVSVLTRELKNLLESAYPFVWIVGEISNLSSPASGHSYFTLKDDSAVIPCVIFKNQKSQLKFRLENGVKVIGIARISLYEPRGSYQLIFEHLDPEGVGALQISFEQLKNKLDCEGLFNKEHKKPIPVFALRICIITSGTGAALRDIIHVSQRRFPGVHLEIIPVSVQGKDAPQEICKAIELANYHGKAQVIILARGGGSIEDLSAFNSENVARAIFNSTIPIITGIGHETDFTIADFVSDLRAPTPSAAAEMAVPDTVALMNHIEGLRVTLYKFMHAKLSSSREMLQIFISRLKTPERYIDESRFKIEDLELRLHHVFKNMLNQKKMIIHHLQSRLHALSPSAVLKRGYCIARSLPLHRVILDSDQVNHNDPLEIILFKGKLITKVVKDNGKKKTDL